MLVIDTFIVRSTAQHFQSPNHMRFGVFYKRSPDESKETRIKVGSWRGYLTRTEAQTALESFQRRLNTGWRPKHPKK